MKKYILLCFLCFCLYGTSQAQIYVKGYTGYALSTGNEKATSIETLNDRRYASSYRLKLGQGLNLGLSIGYALNKNIAFEITGNTQLFSKFKYSKPFNDWGFTSGPKEHYSWSVSGFFGDLEYASTIFQMSPQIVFKSNPYNQWTFYLKGGPNFTGIIHKRTIQSAYRYLGLHTTKLSAKLSGNINTGLQCSFGTEYELSKNICVFAELTTVNVKYTFKKGKILRYEEDGVDMLSTLGSTKNNDLDDRVNFNHAGLNIGIKYIFR